jgi:hypothetical protein
MAAQVNCICSFASPNHKITRILIAPRWRTMRMRSGNSKTGPRSQAARGCGSKIYQQYWRGGKLYLDMVSEHVIARLKDEFPGRPSLRVRDGAKIMAHLLSHAFAEFVQSELPQRLQEALIVDARTSRVPRNLAFPCPSVAAGPFQRKGGHPPSR